MKIRISKQIDDKKEQLVVYEKGSSGIVTNLTDDLKCIYDGKQYDETDERIMSFDKAIVFINNIDDFKYIKDWKEITEERWDEMLNVLPPERWETIKNVEIFAMSEIMTSDITGFYICYKKKYYTTYRRLRFSNTIIVDEFLAEIKKVKNDKN